MLLRECKLSRFVRSITHPTRTCRAGRAERTSKIVRLSRTQLRSGHAGTCTHHAQQSVIPSFTLVNGRLECMQGTMERTNLQIQCCNVAQATHSLLYGSVTSVAPAHDTPSCCGMCNPRRNGGTSFRMDRTNEFAHRTLSDHWK
jgi:hypothetical protein